MVLNCFTALLQRSATLMFLLAVPTLVLNPSLTGQVSPPELVIQTGHMVGIHGLVFSPRSLWTTLGFPNRQGSGEILAVGGNDGVLELWDVVKRQQVRTLSSGDPGGVMSVAFSSDSKLVAAAGNGVVNIWSVASGALLHTLNGGDTYRSLSFDVTARRLAGGGDKGAVVWDIDREVVEHTLDAPYARVAFDGQTRVVTVGSAQGPSDKLDIYKPYVVRVWNVETGEKLGEFGGHSPRIVSVRFRSDGQLIVWAQNYCAMTHGSCNSIDVWDITSGSEKSLAGPLDTATGGALCPGAASLIAGSNNGDVGLWDIPSGAEVYRSSQTNSFTLAAACNEDLSMFASAETRGRVFLWNRSSKVPEATLTGIVAEVDSVSFDQNRVITGNQGANYNSGYTESVSEWNVYSFRGPQITRGGLPVAVSQANLSYAWVPGEDRQENGATIVFSNAGVQTNSAIVADRGVRMNFSRSGRLLAVAKDKALSVWTVSPVHKEVDFPVLHSFMIEQVVFGADDNTVVSAGSDGVAIVWDVAAKQAKCRVGQQVSPQHTLWAVATNRSGTLLASGGNDGLITLSNLNTCTSVRSWSPGPGSIQALAFSPDEATLASAGSDGIVRVCNLKSRTCRELKGHLWQVESLSFNPAGDILVSGSWDGTTKLWDVATGHELVTLITFANLRDWAAVTPEGLFDASADAASQLFWRVGTSNEVVPLDTYYSDFFHPGIIAELYSGLRPKPTMDLATRLRFPSLRVMGEAGLAHLEKSEGRDVLCIREEFSGTQSDAAKIYTSGGEIVIPGLDSYVRDDSRPDCSYRWLLPTDGGPYSLSAPVQDAKPPTLNTTSSKLFVFTVGVTTYESKVHFRISSTYPRLPFASADADMVKNFFDQQRKLPDKPFSDIVVKEGLRNENATLEHIRSSLAALAKEVGDHDVALLFFAGHGVVQPNEEMFDFIPYLPPPVDELSAPILEERQIGFNTAMLAEAIRDFRTGNVIVIMDACQSGGALESLENIAKMEQSLYDIRKKSDTSSSVPVQMPAIFLLAAATPIEEAGATDKLQHGILSSVVLEVLQRPGSRTTAWDLMDFVNRELPKRAQEQGWSQTALVKHIGADYVLAVGSPLQ